MGPAKGTEGTREVQRKSGEWAQKPKEGPLPLPREGRSVTVSNEAPVPQKTVPEKEPRSLATCSHRQVFTKIHLTVHGRKWEYEALFWGLRDDTNDKFHLSSELKQ